jgi:hypothetical protein
MGPRTSDAITLKNGRKREADDGTSIRGRVRRGAKGGRNDER